MNNLIYEQILNYLDQANIGLILIVGVFILLILLLVSRLLIKSGLFILTITFVTDNIIKFIPIDIYGSYPFIHTIIYGLYTIGSFIFIWKFAKRFRINRQTENYYKDRNIKNRPKNPIKKFFKYSGALPFLIMLLVNILVPAQEVTYRNIISMLTSLSFLFMVFTSLYNTYKKIDNVKENEERMRFDDLKAFFKKDKNSNKNANRKILKTDRNENKNNVKSETISLDKEKIKQEVYRQENNSYIENDLDEIQRDLYNIDIVHLINSNNSDNLSVISLIDLVSGDKKTYKSNKARVNIREDEEYKVDLEFENFNDYDYGRFIDLLLEYSKNKSKYKFQLDIIPQNILNSKIVLYDPSNIYELNKKFEGQFQGQNISMNFPKYKINFITEN